MKWQVERSDPAETLIIESDRMTVDTEVYEFYNDVDGRGILQIGFSKKVVKSIKRLEE